MKKKIFIVDWCVFPFDIMVCLGSSREEVLSELKKIRCVISDEEREQIQMHGTGRTVMLEGGQTILWTANYPKAGSGTIAHEVFHAVQFLTDRVGIQLTNKNDEVFAYMIQYLTNEIGKKL